jgi:hypothetical protein
LMKKRYSLQVRGHQHEWCFDVDAKPEHVEDWRADGLEVWELVNTVPVWLPASLVRPWCIVQDIFHFRNPFGG